MNRLNKTTALLLAMVICLLSVHGCKPASLKKLQESPTPTIEPAAQSGYAALRPGDMGDTVKDLQNRLMDLQYFDSDEATGYYGTVTTESVRLFQRTNQLPVDGIASEQTLQILYSDTAQKYLVRQGDSGTDVASLQRRLKALRYFAKTATGYFGTATTAAIKAFQKRNGLSVDGIAGETTRDLLYSSKAKAAAVSAGSSTTVSKSASAFLAYAKAQLGKRYVSGNEGPNSFDCSGYVYYCLKHTGVSIGRLSAAGYSGVDQWKSVKKSELRPGDILFFGIRGNGKVGHTGIYLGDGKMIHCSSGKGKVVIADLSSNYWVVNYKSAKRVF